jgi:hypothetical protein
MKKNHFIAYVDRNGTVDFFYQPWPERALLWFWASILNAGETSWKSSSSGSLYCTSALYINSHGLINYKDTKTKCCLYWCLLDFIDWRLVSHVGIFDPALWTIALLTFSLVHLPHPSHPSQNQSTVYTDSMWLGGGGGCWVVLEAIFCRSLTLCFWPDSEPTKLLQPQT